MTRRIIAIGFAMITAASFEIAGPARADCPPDVTQGSWSPARDFTASDLLPGPCSRWYSCGPTESVIYDSSCRLVATPPVSVNGVCSAGSGDPSSCNACLTNPPSDQCLWHLEPQ